MNAEHDAASWRTRAGSLNQALLLLAMFLLPGQVAPVYVLSALMLLIWFVQPNLPARVRSLLNNPVFWGFQAYFWLLAVALAWTEDMDAGLSMLDRALALVLIAPVLLTIATPQKTGRYITAFLLGVGLSALMAHYNLIQLHLMPDWPKGIVVDKSPGDTAPIIDRLTYAPILAWAAYLCARQAVISSGRWRWLYGGLFLLMTSNLMFSGGRTGVLVFLVLLVFLGICYLPGRRLTAAVLSIVLAGLAITAGYLGSDHLRERIDLGFAQLADPDPTSSTNSVGLRIGFGINSLRAWREAPVLGAGTGDFTSTYQSINDRYTPDWVLTTNPHNQFLLIAVTTGIVGVLALLFVYFPLPLLRLPFADGRDDLRIALPIWMATISLFESYLWRSNTCLVFVFFCAVIWAGTHYSERESAAAPR